MICKHCSRSTPMSERNARHSGWRVWRGVTLGGQEKEDIVCPACVGDVPEGEKPVGWSVGCLTCDWEWEDEYDEGPLTEADAKSMASDHECEPETYTISPDEVLARRRRDAELRLQFAAARHAKTLAGES